MRYLGLIISALLLNCDGTGDQPRATEQPEIEVISRGEVVDLQHYANKGKVTVFDFYADWCPPCKHLDRSLVDMQAIYGDKLQVYKLDVVKWGSPLAAHHKIKSLPYLIVYNRAGSLQKQGPSNVVLPDLMAALNE